LYDNSASLNPAVVAWIRAIAALNGHPSGMIKSADAGGMLMTMMALQLPLPAAMNLSVIDVAIQAMAIAEIPIGPFDRAIINVELFDEGRCVLSAAIAS
jgi:hypothetical protein